jgi:hypothetical protein
MVLIGAGEHQNYLKRFTIQITAQKAPLLPHYGWTLWVVLATTFEALDAHETPDRVEVF